MDTQRTAHLINTSFKMGYSLKIWLMNHLWVNNQSCSPGMKRHGGTQNLKQPPRWAEETDEREHKKKRSITKTFRSSQPEDSLSVLVPAQCFCSSGCCWTWCLETRDISDAGCRNNRLRSKTAFKAVSLFFIYYPMNAKSHAEPQDQLVAGCHEDIF